MATALGLISYFTIVSVKSDLDLVRSSFTTTLSCMNQAPALPQVDGENGEEGEYDEGPPPSPPIASYMAVPQLSDNADSPIVVKQESPSGIEQSSLGVPKSCPKPKKEEIKNLSSGASRYGAPIASGPVKAPMGGKE